MSLTNAPAHQRTQATSPAGAGTLSLRAATCLALASLLSAGCSARGAIYSRLASYEPSETNLSVTANPGDAGLSLFIVPGGANGVPVATDGDYVLKLEIANETDRKIEFRHAWSNGGYDLADRTSLLVDVFVADSGAIPGLMGIWSSNWSPPDPWQIGAGIPTSTGQWQTVSFDVSSRNQTDLDSIQAFVMENLAGASGTAYVDNLRLRHATATDGVRGVAAVAFADRTEVHWRPTDYMNPTGYHVERSTAPTGPFTRLTASPVSASPFVDHPAVNTEPAYYRVVGVVDGEELPPSAVSTAAYNGLTNDALLDQVQEDTFKYFWDGAHPVSGLAREGLGLGHPLDTVTTGGSGMGLITIMVAADRGFVTRAEAAERVRKILEFLETKATRFHGAFSHHLSGTTGQTIAFAGYKDNGGDLVETAFLIEGMLTVRQYFDDPNNATETEIRERATRMWEAVEWDWYRQHPDSQVLYWHWSPDYGWDLNHAIRGYNEAQIVYLLAIASPTHTVPASCYHNGWASTGQYVNGAPYYGIRQPIGWPLGGPLFFTHYSNLGWDPRYRSDAYGNYFENARAISRIQRAYCTDNPNNFTGYSALLWGLTASVNPWGYSAHSPTNDNGTITPTAALSAMPYTPEASLAALRYMYDTHGGQVYGNYGFYDAFHLGENWVAPGYLAIDQGTIAPMIENYRSGLCWRMFMKNPEIKPALDAIGFRLDVDFDRNGVFDGSDQAAINNCMAGPGIAAVPTGCSAEDFRRADLDEDADVDLADWLITQRLLFAAK